MEIVLGWALVTTLDVATHIFLMVFGAFYVPALDNRVLERHNNTNNKNLSIIW